jgi:hypothetical protein
LRRETYSGYLAHEEDEIASVRKEFVNILLNSDYALDVRGDTNGSMRLFEALSLGRTPVVIDTERILPCADVLDYSQFALIVDIAELPHLADRIVAFHNKLTPEMFKNMQIKAREAYRNYFRIDALTQYLVLELRKQIQYLLEK